MESSLAKPLSFYEPFLSAILKVIAPSTRFRSRPGLADVFERNPRLVVIFNHAAPLSWLPAVSLLASYAVKRGGGPRRPIGVFDRFFYSLPGFRAVAHQMTQSDSPLGFEELVAKFRASVGTDVVIFPEGSNCFFGPSEDLQPFRSPRFVELAIRTSTPILICAHRGSEGWSRTVQVDTSLMAWLDVLPPMISDFLGDRLRSTGLLSLPWLPRPMKHFDMLCELYHPTLTTLSDDPDTAAAQIRDESDRVHLRLEELLSEIDQGLLESPTKPAQVGE